MSHMMDESTFKLACEFCKEHNLLNDDDIDDTHQILAPIFEGLLKLKF